MENRLTLVLVNRLAEIERMSQHIEEFADASGMDRKAVFEANLVLEEIVTNIISYAYDDGAQHEITVNLACEQSVLSITVADDGKAFNPLEQTAPDIDKPLEERKVGGLGIYFVRNLMGEIEYERVNGQNRLRMRKDYLAGKDKSDS